MKIIITGSRTVQNQKLVKSRFDSMFRDYIRRMKPVGTEITIIHGGSIGVDSLIDSIFRSDGDYVKYEVDGVVYDVFLHVFPVTAADWQKHGRKAGLVRNVEMLESGPDVVFAFWRAGLESKGTIHCVSEAARRGVLVRCEVLSEEVDIV